jgi:hypothetical protein
MSSAPDNLPALTGTPAAATQLKDLPLSELQTISREYGLDPGIFDTKPGLVAAILDRRTMIGSLDRDALSDVMHWAGKQVTATTTRERMALEIAKVRSMKFAGLSQRGLVVLGKLRGADVRDTDDTPTVIAKLKGLEGFFAKLGRKRRHIVGKWVSRMIGDSDEEAVAAGQLPPPVNREEAARNGPTNSSGSARPDPRRKLQDEIEDVGIIAGLTSRMRRTADQYLNQKLDEIEARIDRKLDEIDRRLAEWRDKEVANRIRILKISLWATVVVGAATLVISYVRVYMPWIFGG